MRKLFEKVYIIMLTIILILSFSLPASASVPGDKTDNSPAVSSKGAIVFDSVRRQILYTYNSDKKFTIPMAADIMTLLVSADKVKLDSRVTVTEPIKSQNGSEIIFDGGTKYGIDELLLSLILSPTKAVSDYLIQYTIGDEENFINLMNQKAKLLGMKDTNFTAASSYNSEDLEISLDDFSKLVFAAVNNPIIDSYLSTTAKPWTSKDGTRVLINPNKLFWMGLSGINGGAYQSVNNTGNSLTTVSRDGQKLICLVCGGKGDEVFSDTTALMNYCFSKFNKSLLVAKDTVLDEIELSGVTLPLASMEDVYYTHPIGVSYIKNLEFKTKSDIKPPINENMVLGTARYTLNDDTVIEVNMYSKTDIKASSNIFNIIATLKLRLRENKDVMNIIIILCLVELGLIVMKLIKKINKKNKSA